MTVRVQPGASTCGVAIAGDMVRLRVTAPPVEGRANAAVIETLAEMLGVRKARVEILRGAVSRIKTIRIRGITACDVERRLARFLKETSGS